MQVRTWSATLVVAVAGATGWIGIGAQPAGAAGFTVRASSSTTGGEGMGFSNGSTLSDNGRWVAFSSESDNFVAGDTNLTADVFVRDRFTETTVLVSADREGGPSDGFSAEAWISGNGRFVAFMSEATDLVADDTNDAADVFVRDLDTGVTERVSVSTTDGELIDGVSFEPSISDDGRFVEFQSDSEMIVADDFNGSEDVFVRDRQIGTTVRASVATNGAETDFGAYEGVISGNGANVAFTTDTGLVGTDINDEDDVYRRSLTAGTTNRVSSAASGLGGGYSAAISDDGGFIAFVSDYQLSGPGADVNFLPDVYVRNTTAATTARVSLTTANATPNNLSIGPSISDDGRYVAYYTLATDLGAADANATFDVWMRDRTLNTNTRISVDSTGGDPNESSEVPFVAGSGAFVSFQSPATDLTPPDGTFVDVFVRSLADAPVGSAPGAPTAVSAVAGAAAGTAVVSFAPPVSDGGAPITGYAVTAVPGVVVIGGTSSPITVSGLAPGIYTFTVRAINAIGASDASTVSNQVTITRRVAVHWTAAEYDRLVAIAPFYGSTPDQLPKVGVAAVAFIIGIAPSPTPTPVVLEPAGSAVTQTIEWQPDELFFLDNVKARFVFSDEDAHRFSVYLLGFLASVQGH